MRILLALVALGFIGGLGVLGLVMYISYDLPQINSLSDYSPPIPSRIYSKDGHLLMELSKEKRDVVEIEEIPQKVIDGFLAAEDDNFYNHSGIDYVGIMRAMVINIKAGRIVQGASTITQQVAKSLLLTSERTFSRKIKDLILATKIEEKLTKEEILFLYLNQVYLGGGYYGVKSAFKGYFDKELKDATTAEIALIAGLLVAPSKYSPYNRPKQAKSRQSYVLGRLYKTEKISKDEYEAALDEKIKIQIRKPVPLKAGYFSDWIRQRLVAHFGKDDFITNGYKIVTTLDWELQEKAEKEVLEGVRQIDKRQGYKGAVGHLDNDEQIFQFLLKQRNELYSNASNYLIFNPDGTTEKEFKPEEDELLNLKKQRKEEKAQLEGIKRKDYFVIGNQEDPLLKYLDFNKPVKAVVEQVSNSQRIIFANYAGIKIMLPYEYFKWAHPRKIQIERHWWSFQTRPEEIVKPGDIILVQIHDKQENPIKYIHNDFYKIFGKLPEFKKEQAKEKFYLATLDQEPDAQGALISISPNSGEIISMVGGSDFSKSQFNRAVQSNRQPGSSFKPLIYAVGLENGYTPASKLLDSPQALGGVDDSLSWKPRNYDGDFKGTMTFRRSLETSRNIPTIKLLQDVGVDKMLDFVKRVGMEDLELPPDLSISLGSFGINLLNLVKLYSIFPNGGKMIKLKSIVSIKDRNGKIYHLDENEQDPSASEADIAKIKEVPEQSPEAMSEKSVTEGDEIIEVEEEKINPFLANLTDEQVYDRRLAYLMSNLLKGVIQRGTGRHTADISPYIGGKTGTTNNYVDAWFLGFSNKAVTGVWTGFDDNQTLGFGETGSKAALPIWKEFMRNLIRKYGDSDFVIPSGIVNVAIDEKTGDLYEDSGKRSMEAFVEGTEPGINSNNNLTEKEEEGTSILDSEDYYSAQ